MYLNCHSYYSLRYGTLPVEELVAGAVKHKIPLMALTDINATTGIFDFVKLCRKGGIQAIAGVEFRDGNRHLYTAIAKNNEGFREINELLSNHNIHDHPLENPQFSNAFTIYPYGAKPCSKLTDNEFTGIRPGELNRAFREDRSKMVILAPVTFADKTGYLLHSHLRAIGNNILFSRLEPGMLAYPGEVMLPPGELLKIYEHFPRIIQNTEKLAASCSFEFDFRSHKNKHTFTGNIYEDKLLLEKLAYEGFTQRYGQNNKNAAMRLLKELEIIDKLGFSAYFLIAWDIVRFSMSQGFYHVGRGSGANSVVAYCLKITDVDPIELNLYFERFLNPKRTSPPDFDIDFSWKDRDAVQNYIFKKHSTAHTALLGTIPVFKSNSIIRELSKVYGIPKEETDRFLDNPKDELNSNRLFSRIIKLAGLIHGFPNIRSIHAGGILISDLPITCFSALDLPPKGLPTVQFDMYVAEDIGFEKFDILSQRGIGHIRECTEIVIENRGEAVDIHQVEKFKQDPKVKSQLKNGETNGCFYVESPAMRGLLKKLKCDDYLSLVAASSIIRPGVARSGMMREYIQRFNNPGSFSYIHPVMEEQLSETYGVMVYQEDVLKICHHFAGLDLADADVLRRAMSGKYRSKAEFQRIADKFFSNCRDKGYSNKLTSEVWRQIESFAGYSFSKAHSASYAVESFQSLYLKAHYPMEFMTAVINNFGGFYRSWVYFNEARRCGATIELPCINNSRMKTCIRGSSIYIGFIHIGNLENPTILRMIENREKYGSFESLEDLLQRISIGKEQLIILIRTGAFRFTGKSKTELLWDAHLFLKKSPPESGQHRLFSQGTKKFILPELPRTQLEDAYDETELLGFPVTLSFFDMLKTSFRGEVFAKELNGHVGKKVRMAGQLVTIKYVRTIKKEMMHFATFIDCKGEFFDTVHFPDSLKKYPFRGSGVYLILGKITEEFGHASLETEKMAKLELNPDPRN